jgi:hypothetical protein
MIANRQKTHMIDNIINHKYEPKLYKTKIETNRKLDAGFGQVHPFCPELNRHTLTVAT